MRDTKQTHSHRGFTAILLSVVALGIGTQLIERSRDRDRQMLEYERLSIDRERMDREMALQEMRYLDSQEQRREARVLQPYAGDEYRRARERAETERWQDKVEAQVRSAERENRAFALQAHYAQRNAEIQDRQQAQRDRQIAQAEVDRQNRWVAQREYEEERARHDRYYRLQAEDSQKRFERSRDEFLRQRAHGM
ncbi:hypothetical protein [Usitatibacter palustris]|uniref:Uncharacterized protein n=1 Tax=Usitatibacter palustris TaxID=2732487 RepID=A0A6M4H8H1_9PROT|nr:hypothetical protein [Usitatibacter palustris]QJR15465.1 hypothetical protein DSM104440_02286 [Usitatibacter palustris]